MLHFCWLWQFHLNHVIRAMTPPGDIGWRAYYMIFTQIKSQEMVFEMWKNCPLLLIRRIIPEFHKSKANEIMRSGSLLRGKLPDEILVNTCMLCIYAAVALPEREWVHITFISCCPRMHCIGRYLARCHWRKLQWMRKRGDICPWQYPRFAFLPNSWKLRSKELVIIHFTMN